MPGSDERGRPRRQTSSPSETTTGATAVVVLAGAGGGRGAALAGSATTGAAIKKRKRVSRWGEEQEEGAGGSAVNEDRAAGGGAVAAAGGGGAGDGGSDDAGCSDANGGGSDGKRSHGEGASATARAETTAVQLQRQHRQRQRRREEVIDELDREMEVAERGRTSTGQLRKKHTRKQSKALTKKRKALERQEWLEATEMRARELELHDEGNAGAHGGGGDQPLRGSKVAIEDHVIRGSLVFGAGDHRRRGMQRQEEEEEEEEEEDDYGGDGEDDDGEQEEEEEDVAEEEEKITAVDDDDDDDDNEDDEGGAADNEEEDDMEEGGDEEGIAASRKREGAAVPAEPKDGGDNNNDDSGLEGTGSTRKPKTVGKRVYATVAIRRVKRRRRVFGKLRNFRSFRMAERHGDALAAHARGRPKEALQKLRELARDAPSAPQVYFSLGMVYEDRLNESRRRRQAAGSPPTEAAAATDVAPHEREFCEKIAAAQLEEGESSKNMSESGSLSHRQQNSDTVVPADSALAEQLGLAKKAYGSYHVAAILCKRDHSIWVRAADLATEIAEIHASVLASMPPEPHVDGVAAREFHLAERQRWLNEAKNDYQACDKLAPPGIDVPAKLATVLIELGCLSEALTILTDLKNRPPVVPGRDRSEFESSYRAWLLYSDLMLQIGHECSNWNAGIQTNKNFMFRRWLRKLARTFDWKERRLQSLAKALEAAAGTKCCEKLLQWLKWRVSSTHDAGIQGGGDDKNGEAMVTGSDTGDQDVSSTSEKTGGHAEGGGNSAIDKELEHERDLLVKMSQSELAAFDKTTEEMLLEVNQMPSNERERARATLLKHQRHALSELEDEYKRKNGSIDLQETSRLKEPPPPPNDTALEEIVSPLPISGSVKTVQTIAAELMQHMIGMQLYGGGALVGESVSVYLKERAALQARRYENQRRLEEHSQQSPMLALQGQAYDEDKNDDDSSDVPISDDEYLLDDEQSTLIESMRRGALSAELSVLYALSLLGQGGKNFLAFNFLQAIRVLEREHRSSFIQKEACVSALPEDISWASFKHAATAPLSRLAALAMTADVVQAIGKEEEFAARLDPLFRSEADYVAEEGIVDDVLSRMKDERFPLTRNQQHVLKVVFASARYQVAQAGILIAESKQLTDSKILLTQSIASLTKIFAVRWTICSSTSPGSSQCVGMLQTISQALRLLSQHFQSPGRDFLERLQAPVNAICGCSGLGMSVLNEEDAPDLNCFPFRSARFSAEGYRLSLRALNLCVACNLPSFSGWKTQPYKIPPSFASSWIRVRNNVLTGLLCEFEDDIADQWDFLEKEFLVSACQFRTHLLSLRETLWYKNAKAEKETACAVRPIASHGEHYGLSFVLSFSRSCLLLAKELKAGDKSLSDGLVFTSLSILLPVSQFCVNQKLWDSPLGWLERKKVVVRDERKAESSAKTSPIESKEQHVKETVPDSSVPVIAITEAIQNRESQHYQSPRQKILREQQARAKVDQLRQELAHREQMNALIRKQESQHRQPPLEERLFEQAIRVHPVPEKCAMSIDSEPGPERCTVLVDDEKKDDTRDSSFRHAHDIPAREKTPANEEKKIRALQDCLLGENATSSLSNIVAIPCTALNAEWKRVASSTEEKVATNGDGLAARMMSGLDGSLLLLRDKAYSERSVEKASLEIAVALLNLASCPECENPFLCMQQAALFASAAPKLGTSDDGFRQALPKLEDCTPRLALSIIGRAECLQAVHFVEEAAFLCSFVASACSHERESGTWNSMWKIVRIVAYNASQAIHYTANTLRAAKKDGREQFSSMVWAPEVIEELKRGRSDGHSMKASLNREQASCLDNATGVQKRAGPHHDHSDDRGERFTGESKDDDSTSSVVDFVAV